MPSSPKIKKEDMLKAALEIISEKGYTALNIKSIAEKLGCSTAPISWQFKGMEGLRKELVPFVERYVQHNYYSRCENNVSAFELKGMGTIDLALEQPNLFAFLYMGDRKELLSTGFDLHTENLEKRKEYEKMADVLGITLEQAIDFTMMMIIYTQGMGTLIASGIVKDTKENMHQMLHNTGITYLKGLGVKENILQTLSGGSKADESSSKG